MGDDYDVDLEPSLEQLRHGAAALERIAASFVGLRAAERLRPEDGTGLLNELNCEKRSVGRCSLGDPARAPSRPLLRSSDVPVRVFGEASTALFRASLAAHEWEAAALERQASELQQEALWAAMVAQADEMEGRPQPEQLLAQMLAQASQPSQKAAARPPEDLAHLLAELAARAARLGPQREARRQLAEVLARASELRARLLDFHGAHRDVQRSLDLEPDFPEACALARQYARACAAASPQVLGMGDGRQADPHPGSMWAACAPMLFALRSRLLALGYNEPTVLQVSQATSLLELFTEGAFNDVAEASARSFAHLIGLIKLFLLHHVLPMSRVVELLGSELCAFLLRQRALTLCRGAGAALVEPAEASQLLCGMREAEGCSEQEYVFANVALWPVLDDLIVATDCDEQAYEEGGWEPVMYLSVDSFALLTSAPRQPPASRLLDLCCGSGIQGLVALRTYAEHATFVDVNPRALNFAAFNAHLNGFGDRASFVAGNVCEPTLLSGREGTFDVVLMNPPFVPNPSKVASAFGPLYSGGGADGQLVLAAALKRCACHLLAPGGRLTAVATVPNAEDFGSRVEKWVDGGIADVAATAARGAFQAVVFRSEATLAEDFLRSGFQGRPPIEHQRYLAGLRRAGVRSMSDVVLAFWLHAPGVERPALAAPRVEVRPECKGLWTDEALLRSRVQVELGERIAGDQAVRKLKEGMGALVTTKPLFFEAMD